MSLLAPSEPNIVRDPPPELPTTVDPIIVYSAPASSTSLAGVQITGFRNTAAGTVPASLFNAAQVKAANPGLQGQALYNAWAVSSQRADSEAFANTLGHEITTFVGGSWLQNSNPGGGYWHGIM